MLAFCRQLAERTESSSSSTERKRFSLSLASSFGASATTGSSVSSKLTKTVSCSLMIFAAYATASCGVTEPSVHTSRVSLS